MSKYKILEDLIYSLDLNTYEFMDFEKKVVKSLGKKNEVQLIKNILNKVGVSQEDLEEAAAFVIKDFKKDFEIVEITNLLKEDGLKGLRERKHQMVYLSNGRSVVSGYINIDNDGDLVIISDNAYNQVENIRQLWEKREKK